MNYKVYIWQGDNFKREIVYSADNDIQAIQMASAATPDGCRATYEQSTEQEQSMPYGKGTYGSKRGRPSKGLKGKQKNLPAALKKKIMAAKKKK
jgi:hypothetical protein